MHPNLGNCMCRGSATACNPIPRPRNPGTLVFYWDVTLKRGCFGIDTNPCLAGVGLCYSLIHMTMNLCPSGTPGMWPGEGSLCICVICITVAFCANVLLSIGPAASVSDATLSCLTIIKLHVGARRRAVLCAASVLMQRYCAMFYNIR